MESETPTETTNIKMEPEAPDYTEARAPDYTPKQSDAPPPSYDAIYGKLQTIKDNSNSKVDYGRRVVNYVFCGTICTLLWALLLLAIPIAMIVIGAKGLKNCTIERYIPIYLVVAGVFGVIKALANIAEMVFHRKKGTDEEERKPVNPFDGCINLFLLGWFIAGSYWVYHVHNTYQSHTPGDVDYCEKTLYLFAFWIITIQYIFMLLAIFMCVCGCCFLTCMGLAFGSNKE